MRRVFILLLSLLLVSACNNELRPEYDVKGAEKLYIYEIHTTGGLQDTIRLKTKLTLQIRKGVTYIEQPQFGYFYIDRIKYLGFEATISK